MEVILSLMSLEITIEFYTNKIINFSNTNKNELINITDSEYHYCR